MLQRAALLIALALLLVLAFHGWGTGYISMQLEKVGNKPYLIVQHLDADNNAPLFNVYTPKGNNWGEWEEVINDRTGPAYGIFLAPPVPPPAPKEGEARPDNSEKVSSTERLGILHEERVSVFDLKAIPPAQTFETLPFKWIAETGVMLDGKAYVFGVEMSEISNDDNEPIRVGELKAARYDGQKWEELKIKGPKVETKPLGFSLIAVQYLDGAHIFWRNAALDQALGPNIEGPRVTTEGTVMMATFAGDAFGPKAVTINGLPRGNTSIWAEGDQIRMLIQTRLKLEDALASNGPMEFWNVAPDGSVKHVETIEDSRAKSGLLAFIQAEHLNWDGQEYIVRSNLKSFEVWRKSNEGKWINIAPHPFGLRTYDIETPLLGVLGLCLALIAFGAGLAYQRRREALSLMRKIQANEIYGSVGLRSGAYVVDLTLILVATCVLTRLQGAPYVSPLGMLNITTFLYWPFYVVYMVYLAGAEWLLGTTPGKFLMGLSVVRDSGARLTLWSAIVRNLVGFFERHPIVAVFISSTMIILGPRRQRMGDVLARTVVVQRAALAAYKAQRSLEVEQHTAQQDNMMLLPPVNTSWDKLGSPDKESAASDKDDKGKRP